MTLFRIPICNKVNHSESDWIPSTCGYQIEKFVCPFCWHGPVRYWLLQRETRINFLALINSKSRYVTPGKKNARNKRILPSPLLLSGGSANAAYQVSVGFFFLQKSASNSQIWRRGIFHPSSLITMYVSPARTETLDYSTQTSLEIFNPGRNLNGPCYYLRFPNPLKML